jgi:transposase
MEDLKEFFEKPITPKHKQYEVLRGYIKEGYSIKELEDKFGYKRNTIYSLIRDLKAGKLELFTNPKPGPKNRRVPPEAQKEILKMRFNNMTTSEIKNALEKNDVFISVKTIERILYEAGLSKTKIKH